MRENAIQKAMELTMKFFFENARRLEGLKQTCNAKRKKNNTYTKTKEISFHFCLQLETDLCHQGCFYKVVTRSALTIVRGYGCNNNNNNKRMGHD